MYRLLYHGLTRPGRFHRKNEDSLLIFIPRNPSLLKRKGTLFVVADGAGGHSAGEVASRLAVETIRDAYYFNPKRDLEALAEAFRRAHERIKLEASQRGDVLATTATALLCRDQTAFFAQVGNSRLHLFREGELRILSRDHTLVEALVRKGILDPEEARRHPKRHILTQALGVKMAPPHLGRLSLRPGDVFLLSTDGAHEVIGPEEMKRVLSEGISPRHVVRELAREIEARGSPDDYTLLCLKVLD